MTTKAPKITRTLAAGKVTKGAVRFDEVNPVDPDWPVNVYLRKEQVEELGIAPAMGVTITLEITPSS